MTDDGAPPGTAAAIRHAQKVAAVVADLDNAARNARRAPHLRRRYGITIDIYNAMFRAQDGRCALCRRPFRCRPYVDHDHGPTKRTRGLLDRWCNDALRLLRDDPAIAERAARYLRSTKDWRHHRIRRRSD